MSMLTGRKSTYQEGDFEGTAGTAGIAGPRPFAIFWLCVDLQWSPQ